MKIMDYRSIFGLILLALMSQCATYMDESDMKDNDETIVISDDEMNSWASIDITTTIFEEVQSQGPTPGPQEVPRQVHTPYGPQLPGPLDLSTRNSVLVTPRASVIQCHSANCVSCTMEPMTIGSPSSFSEELDGFLERVRILRMMTLPPIRVFPQHETIMPVPPMMFPAPLPCIFSPDYYIYSSDDDEDEDEYGSGYEPSDDDDDDLYDEVEVPVPRLEAIVQRMEEATPKVAECPICLVGTPNILLLGCNHLGACEVCVDGLTNGGTEIECPICKRIASEHIRCILP